MDVILRLPNLYGRMMNGSKASIGTLEKNDYGFAKEEVGAEDGLYGVEC